jgi:hypothetical protein
MHAIVAPPVSPPEMRYERRVDIHHAFLILRCALTCWKSLQTQY